MKISNRLLIILCTVFSCLLFFSPVNGLESKVKTDTRCTVCGMFVAKYPAWISRVTHKSGKNNYFDGVKDMLVYYFNPEKFGSSKNDPIVNLYVKDYYSLEVFDAKDALFVVGSDVYGPMGHEFIPFSSIEAAKSFKKDHHGKEILTLEKVTSKRVEALRSGHKMK